MHSVTNTLMPGVCKPGFPKWGQLVWGWGQFRHDVSELSHMLCWQCEN